MNDKDSTFTLPKDGDIFTNSIIERCEHLIDAGIWDGLDAIRLNTWMKNWILILIVQLLLISDF